MAPANVYAIVLKVKKGIRHSLLPNEPVEKVTFLKTAPAAGSKIRICHFLSLTFCIPRWNFLIPMIYFTLQHPSIDPLTQTPLHIYGPLSSYARYSKTAIACSPLVFPAK
jgi:hypothetical protein